MKYFFNFLVALVICIVQFQKIPIPPIEGNGNSEGRGVLLFYCQRSFEIRIIIVFIGDILLTVTRFFFLTSTSGNGNSRGVGV